MDRHTHVLHAGNQFHSLRSGGVAGTSSGADSVNHRRGLPGLWWWGDGGVSVWDTCCWVVVWAGRWRVTYAWAKPAVQEHAMKCAGCCHQSDMAGVGSCGQTVAPGGHVLWCRGVHHSQTVVSAVAGGPAPAGPAVPVAAPALGPCHRGVGAAGLQGPASRLACRPSLVGLLLSVLGSCMHTAQCAPGCVAGAVERLPRLLRHLTATQAA